VVPPGQKPQLQQRPPLQPGQPGFGQPTLATPGQPGQLQPKPPQRPAQPAAPFGNFFGGGVGNTAPAPRQVAPPGAAPRPPATNGAPRPPAAVGRSAAVPPANPTR
jgi:hypothetical protein